MSFSVLLCALPKRNWQMPSRDSTVVPDLTNEADACKEEDAVYDQCAKAGLLKPPWLKPIAATLSAALIDKQFEIIVPNVMRHAVVTFATTRSEQNYQKAISQ